MGKPWVTMGRKTTCPQMAEERGVVEVAIYAIYKPTFRGGLFFSDKFERPEGDMDSFNGHIKGEGMQHKPGSVISGNETILIVDDNKDIRRFLDETLNMFGYSVICAEDGADGLKKFIENRDKIRLMLLDVIMPRKNGIELYREIKYLEPDAKVIFMSGYNEVISRQKDFREAVVKCIPKPFSIKTLLKEVREALDK
jgi:CheY-like chemotaxis protein